MYILFVWGIIASSGGSTLHYEWKYSGEYSSYASCEATGKVVAPKIWTCRPK